MLSLQDSNKKFITSKRINKSIICLKINIEDYNTSINSFSTKKYISKHIQNISDVDFKNRHESAYRNINALKAESDDLKVQLRNRALEINDLETDENTLKSQLDQRNIEIEKLKAELNSAFGKNLYNYS